MPYALFVPESSLPPHKQETVVASLVGLAVLAYSLVLLSVSFSVWIYIIGQWKSDEPILEQRPTDVCHWGAIDVVIGTIGVIALIILLSGIFVGPIDRDAAEELTIQQKTGAMWAQMIAQSLVCLGIAVTIVMRGGGAMFFGTGTARLKEDVWIGVIAFCALCIPVIAIQILAGYLTPYEHPLINMLIEDPQPSVLIPVLVSAVLIAPITEEFAFRLVLQGWLEDFMGGRLGGRHSILLGRTDNEEMVPPLSDPEDSAESEFEFVAPYEDSPNPYTSPALVSDSEAAAQADVGIHVPSFQITPIVISSALFAILHLGQGAAWIPLFFLALGLGYVYQKTRTLTPSLVVHMLLNGQSMGLLLIQLFFGESASTPPV